MDNLDMVTIIIYYWVKVAEFPACWIGLSLHCLPPQASHPSEATDPKRWS